MGGLGRGSRTCKGEQGGDEHAPGQGPGLLEIADGADPIVLGKTTDRARDGGIAGPINRVQQVELQAAAATLLGAVETGATIGATVH
ncbi:hypothetical protein, partial [Thiocapsa sp.]|uniref:hypothetical protein n=1 Tax=Thiocapsa sp. TaxID=2024551 RepID=UPI0026011012